MYRQTFRGAIGAIGALALVATVAGCSSGPSGDDSKTVVVASHDSWAMSKDVIKAFEKKSGYTVKVRPSGDAGELTNRLILTKDSPTADAVFGIDNTFATRAVDEGILADHEPSDLPASAKDFVLPDADAARQLTPVDYGDVCVNIDDTWFAQHRIAPPQTLDDLTKPAYKDLFVTPGATTSSPGLAFLIATIAEKGGAWPDYWRKLLANGAKITAGWSDAYEVDFTAGGGKGDRPIVLSYASSPPFTIPDGAEKPTTSALLDTCWRQVEYAGVLKGAKNSKGAAAFVDFMVGKKFQSAIPDNMYMYPVNTAAGLPEIWAKWAKVSPDPAEMSPADIAAHRDEWLREWRDLTSR